MARAHTQSQSPYTWPEPAFMHGHCPYTKPIPMHMATTHARATVHTHATDRTCATARANSSASTRANAALMRVPAPATMRVGRAPTLKKAAAAVDCRRYDRVVPKPINGSFAHGASAAGDKEVVSAARTVCLPVHCSGRRPPSLKIGTNTKTKHERASNAPA